MENAPVGDGFAIVLEVLVNEVVVTLEVEIGTWVEEDAIVEDPELELATEDCSSAP